MDSRPALGLTLLLAVLLSASAKVLPSSGREVGSPCRLPTGHRGECSLVTDCSPAVTAVMQGTRRGTQGALPRCGFQGNVEIVCCGNKTSGLLHTAPTPKSGTSPAVQTPTERKATTACHYYTEKCKNSKPYISGGTAALLGEFPHMAALGFPINENGQNISWDCGATLISERYVMTAAHCTSIRKTKPTVVRLGDLDLSTDEDSATPVDLSIEEILTHPSFNSKTNGRYHDLALLRLKQAVNFTAFICPACLYTSENSPSVSSGGDHNDLMDRILTGEKEIGPRINDEEELQERKLSVSGWGRTEHGGDKSPILQKAELKPYSSEECNITLSKAFGKSQNDLMPRGFFPPGFLCAGVKIGKEDSCQGDSGGPLQFLIKDSPIYTVVGVTSFGEKCGFQLPGVYTRVSAYIDWIEDKVWPGAPPS